MIADVQEVENALKKIVALKFYAKSPTLRYALSACKNSMIKKNIKECQQNKKRYNGIYIRLLSDVSTETPHAIRKGMTY